MDWPCCIGSGYDIVVWTGRDVSLMERVLRGVCMLTAMSDCEAWCFGTASPDNIRCHLPLIGKRS